MVSSLDGMIAKMDNSVSWFETPDTYDKGVDAETPEEFSSKVDCYVMGSHTYEHALALSKEYGWPYGDKPTIVLSSRPLQSDRPNIEFSSGDLNRLVNERLKPVYKRVWVVGGATVTNDFLRLNLADEIRISMLPIILGEGLPFFDRSGQEKPLHLADVKAFKNGMVELNYEIAKP